MSPADTRHPWLTLCVAVLGIILVIGAAQHFAAGRGWVSSFGYAGLAAVLGGGGAAVRLRRQLRERSSGPADQRHL